MTTARGLSTILLLGAACLGASAQPAAPPQSLSLSAIDQIATNLAKKALESVDSQGFAPYKASSGTILAQGDSWFDYPFYDVLQDLEGVYQWKVQSAAKAGDTLNNMVYNQDQLSTFIIRMKRLHEQKEDPKAILISGGGNDVAGQELSLLLNNARSGLPKLNDAIVTGIIDVRLRTSYLTFIKELDVVSEHLLGKRIPILIHGYDYAVPDGRGFLGGWGPLPGPWLKPSFDALGYPAPQQNIETVHLLIDRFNAVLAQIPKEPGYENVCYVKITGTLSSTWENGEYQKDWGNELHPTRDGFKRVAAKFEESLRNCARIPR